MDDLGAVLAHAHIAKAQHARARHELLGLAALKMEEAQGQRGTRVIDQRDSQLRTKTEAAFDAIDACQHLGAGTDRQLGNRGQPGAVFVAQRQVEPQILQLDDADAREALDQSRPHAGQAADRSQPGIDRRRRRLDAECLSGRIRARLFHRISPRRGARAPSWRA